MEMSTLSRRGEFRCQGYNNKHFVMVVKRSRSWFKKTNVDCGPEIGNKGRFPMFKSDVL